LSRITSIFERQSSGENARGAFLIEIDLDDVSTFYNEFNKDELSSHLINYIDQEVTKTKGRERVTIRINIFFDAPDEQKEHMKTTLERYFEHEIHDVMLHKSYDDMKDITLCIAGVAVVVLADLARNLNTGFVTDLLLVIGSFALLQALTDIIFADAARRIQLRRKKQLSASKIVFVQGTR